jgi:hypothetical protein
MQTTLKLTIEIPIDDRAEGFIELITGGKDHCGDVLVGGFSGYWAQGIRRAKSDYKGRRAWLVHEMDCPQQLTDKQETRLFEDGREALSKGVLPKHFKNKANNYHWFDRSLAIKAIKIGCEQFGVDNFLDGVCDYGDYDTALQKALFGEVVYG